MTEQQLKEETRKLEAFFEHEGFEVFAKLMGGLIEREQMVLRTQKLDNEYYKRIGFLRAIKYVSELKNVVKDKKIRQHLLSQGNALGLDYALKFAKQEIGKNKQILNQAKATSISPEEQMKFFEQNKV